MNGLIFDIKEFSIHDGPGGRMTVFFKGCPLRCKWCHNPEGLSGQKQLMYKENLCTHCGKCFEKCNHIDCQPFNRCVHICANGAIEIAGKVITSTELANIILKNKDMFDMMSGGVTFSGGEPMLQSDFILEVIEKIPNIHKAIQTSGFTDIDTYKKVIEKVDYVMQDIKLVDEKEHIKYTGVSNKIILENINWLKQSGKDFVFRVPLIPNVTATKENLELISELCEGYNVEYLPYNNLAGVKYKMLGMNYDLQAE